MSARGARNRKAVAKDIATHETKQEIKQQQERRQTIANRVFGNTTTISAGQPMKPQLTSTELGRHGSRCVSSSASVSPGNRPRFNTFGTASLDPRPLRSQTPNSSSLTSNSDASQTDKSKKLYQIKSKDTQAPRGRGAGVPAKKITSYPMEGSQAPSLPGENFDADLLSANNEPRKGLWVWQGRDSGMRPYGGFDWDEDLQSGSVLVFFKQEQAPDEVPRPQLRADLATLEKAGSTWLTNALRYGRIEPYGGEESAQPFAPFSPAVRSVHLTNVHGQDHEGFRNISGSGYSHVSSAVSPGTPTHELWFSAPQHVRTPEEQTLHFLAVRNYLALLHGKPIVGAEVFEMLSTLQREIEVMHELDDRHAQPSVRDKSVQMIMHYLVSRGLDDPRYNVRAALGLLAWSEQESVRWRQQYIECFVHLAGRLTPQIENLVEFKRLSIGTRRNLNIASRSLQLQVLEVEEQLAIFDFSDLWDSKVLSSSTYRSYTAFRSFLVSFYSRMYGAWPPAAGKTWLNRKVATSLQKHLGGLYEYLVNRNVCWDSDESRPGKKWQMQNCASPNEHMNDFGLAEMLVAFDNKHGFLHIPHPLPLLPKEVPLAQPVAKKNFLSGFRKQKSNSTGDAKAQLELSILFSDATNIEKLDSSFQGSSLIDQYERLELSSELRGASPCEARLGRWVLLYGVLQVLSRLSVDVKGLKYTEAPYFLCADLGRCPDWVVRGQLEQLEPSQLRSWCWQRDWDTERSHQGPVELDSVPLPFGGELHGTTPTVATTPTGSHTAALGTDIERICEKIDGMCSSGTETRDDGPAAEFNPKIDNAKFRQDDLLKTKTKQLELTHDELRGGTDRSIGLNVAPRSPPPLNSGADALGRK